MFANICVILSSSVKHILDDCDNGLVIFGLVYSFQAKPHGVRHLALSDVYYFG
jgi:hypothetical protein